MSIGASANDFAFMLLFGLSLLLVPGILLGIGALIGRVFGLKNGLFPLIFLALVGAGIFYGGSLYLDGAGQVVQAQVYEKKENISIRQEGDWRDNLSVTVRYRTDGTTPTGELPNIGDSNSSLKLSAAQFDSLREQENVPLRVLPLWHSIALVRLESISTRDLVPLPWLIGGALAVALIWLAFQIGKTRVGCLAITLLVCTAALLVPGVIVYREWQAMEDLSAKPLRAQAQVKDVQRITKIDPLPCHGSCRDNFDTEFDVPQQYDIVQLTFMPEGARDMVIGVDAADDGTFHAGVGSTVEIAYSAADPRDIQLLGATHSHHWKNMLAFVGMMAALGIGFLLITGIFNWLSGRAKRALKRVA